MWFSKIFKTVYYNFCYSFLQSKMIYYTFTIFSILENGQKPTDFIINLLTHTGETRAWKPLRATHRALCTGNPHLGFYARCAVRPVTSLTSHSAVHSLCGTSWGRALVDFCEFYSWAEDTSVRSCWFLPLFYWYSRAEHTDTQQFVEVFSLSFLSTN